MKRCPKCGSFNQEADSVCGICGQALTGGDSILPWQLERPSRGQEEDERILGLTNELIQQMRIRRKQPISAIVWKDYIPTGRGAILVRSDEPMFELGELVLAARARGRLGLEDWRALIASSLVYRSLLMRKTLRHLFLKLFVPLTVFFACLFLALFWFYVPLQAFTLIAVIGYYVVTAMFFSLLLTRGLSPRYIRKMRLLSDRLATETVGRDAFLRALSDVNTQNFADVQKLEHRRFTYRFSSRPKLSNRVQNIASWTQGPVSLQSE